MTGQVEISQFSLNKRRNALVRNLARVQEVLRCNVGPQTGYPN